jgi:hypothetical protein
MFIWEDIFNGAVLISGTAEDDGFFWWWIGGIGSRLQAASASAKLSAMAR